MTSLHCAVEEGNIEILNLLISYGGDVHLRDRVSILY